MNTQVPVEFMIAPRARKAIKGQWPVALPIGFIAGILNTLVQVVFLLTLTPVMNEVTGLMQKGFPLEYITQWIQQNMLPALVPSALTWLAAVLVTPALSLGMHAYTLKLLRGEEGRIMDVFCRMNIFGKGLWLSLMIGLRVLLWSLAGVGAYLGLVYLMTVAGMYNLVMSLLPVLATLATIPGFVAMLRYKVADFALADLPDTKVSEAMRTSRALTHKRKLRLVSLLVGWVLLANLVSLLMSGSVFGMALSMLASLICAVYMEVLTGSYYLTFREADEAQFAENRE